MPLVKTDRDTIIRDAIHLFKVQGYYHTSMANIADACGLIKGSIYHYFSSKEELGLACLQYIHEYFNQQIFSFAYIAEMDDVEKLAKMTDAVEEYFLHSEGGCLLGNLTLEVSSNIQTFRDEIEAYFNNWEKALLAILKQNYGKAKARQLARENVASTQGSIMMMRLYDDCRLFRSMNKKTRQLLAESVTS